MTRKQIDAAREVRLWLGQIVIPIAGILAVSPEAREVAKQKYQEAKRFISDKLDKK